MEGLAVLFALGVVAVLLGMLLIGIELGAAVAARHRAEAAADLGALAAAGHAVHGEGPACGRADGKRSSASGHASASLSGHQKLTIAKRRSSSAAILASGRCGARSCAARVKPLRTV